MEYPKMTSSSLGILDSIDKHSYTRTISGHSESSLETLQELNQVLEDER